MSAIVNGIISNSISKPLKRDGKLVIRFSTDVLHAASANQVCFALQLLTLVLAMKCKFDFAIFSIIN